jgi:hypothetical protein
VLGATTASAADTQIVLSLYFSKFFNLLFKTVGLALLINHRRHINVRSAVWASAAGRRCALGARSLSPCRNSAWARARLSAAMKIRSDSSPGRGRVGGQLVKHHSKSGGRRIRIQ